VETKYNRLKTARLRFLQIYRQGNRVLREEEGTLYLRKPGQMRWEYEEPEPKLFLTDGSRLILYLPDENRVTETAVKKSGDWRTPLRFLLGRLRFSEEFRRIETATDFSPLENHNLLLKAFSERLEDRLEWVLFEISPQYRIRRLILQEPGDIQQEFRFEDEESNLPLAEQLFRFQPPEGAEVIRQ
jgi:outer membrane lipoprotein carrier protein